jgi:predicted molibdopterin-dependent oxidoreductase YjgC
MHRCRSCELRPQIKKPSLSADSTLIEIQVNDETAVCRLGDILADVLIASGHPVPMLCRHPKLPAFSACRVCIVEVTEQGRTRVVSSCDFQVTHPLSVQTDTPRIQHHREVIFGLLRLEAPNAECIHALARDFHVSLDPMSFRIEGELNCIRCGRCVSVCQTVVMRNALEMSYRSRQMRPAFAFGEETGDDCDNCGACAAVCPTGARKTAHDPLSKDGPLCNFCTLICPEGAVSKSPDTGEPVIDRTRCKKCGLCVHYCPEGALREESDCDR